MHSSGLGSCPMADLALYLTTRQSLSLSASAIDEIMVDVREIGCEDGKWTELVQDRVRCPTSVRAV
jgi:hypothetical protein